MNINQLEEKIKLAYEQGVSLEDAERLAAEFLHAQIQVSKALKTADLDARMRKAGLKAIRGAILLDEISKTDKKPADSILEALVNTNTIVQETQESYDKAEVESAELQRMYDIVREAHIYFRNLGKNG